jgi:hypothetical protein
METGIIFYWAQLVFLFSVSGSSCLNADSIVIIIYSFRLGNQLVAALSDPSVAKDLMVTNGTIFSSRMDMFVEVQTIFLRRPITGTGYYDTW